MSSAKSTAVLPWAHLQGCGHSVPIREKMPSNVAPVLTNAKIISVGRDHLGGMFADAGLWIGVKGGDSQYRVPPEGAWMRRDRSDEG